MTIEDETAAANIIVWPKTFERFRPIILGARYVAVSGQLQQESGVIHVVAAKLDDLTPLLARLTEDAPPIQSLARADAVKRPHDEDIDSRARRRRNPPRIAAPAELPDLLASDLDVPARGSAHAPSRRGGTEDRASGSDACLSPVASLLYGTMPSRPTLTRAASNVPSGFFVAPTILMLAPGLSSSLLPTT